MAPGQPTYEIVDGVRRAKVFQVFGLPAIQAEVQGQPGIQMIPIDALRSPHKTEIDTTLPGGSIRYNRLCQAVAAGKHASLPPITVRKGSRGVRVQQVRVI